MRNIRSHKNRRKNQLARMRLVVVIGLALVGLSLLISKPSSKSGSGHEVLSSVSTKSNPNLDAVNFHLQQMNRSRELRQGWMDSENQELAPSLEGSEELEPEDLKKPTLSYGLDFKQEESAEDVFNDITESTSTPSGVPTPDERIRSRVNQKHWEAEYDKALNKAYVDEFVNKAKEQGYRVRVNKNLDVTGVRKLKGQ